MAISRLESDSYTVALGYVSIVIGRFYAQAARNWFSTTLLMGKSISHLTRELKCNWHIYQYCVIHFM